MNKRLMREEGERKYICVACFLEWDSLVIVAHNDVGEVSVGVYNDKPSAVDRCVCGNIPCMQQDWPITT